MERKRSEQDVFCEALERQKLQKYLSIAATRWRLSHRKAGHQCGKVDLF